MGISVTKIKLQETYIVICETPLWEETDSRPWLLFSSFGDALFYIAGEMDKDLLFQAENDNCLYESFQKVQNKYFDSMFLVQQKWK